MPIVENAHGAAVERGPDDLRDLPRFFGRETDPHPNYGGFDIEILAEINHAPALERADLLGQAERFAAEGADVIDLGCNPGESWLAVGDVVSLLRDRGLRVSIDTFDQREAERAAAAGAELVLSVNSSNREARAIGALRSSRYPIGRAHSMASMKRSTTSTVPAFDFASTRSSSRSASDLHDRSGVISKSAAVIPKPA